MWWGGWSSLVDCPPGEVWQQVAPGELGPCERTCWEPNATESQSNCSAGQAPGCVCQPGHFRSQAGPCVPADRCECWRHGHPHPVSHCSPSVALSPSQPQPPIHWLLPCSGARSKGQLHCRPVTLGQSLSPHGPPAPRNSCCRLLSQATALARPQAGFRDGVVLQKGWHVLSWREGSPPLSPAWIRMAGGL